jgi:amino acid adenylation domain-containing protein
MLVHFHNLLQGITANADTPLWQLPLVSPAEQQLGFGPTKKLPEACIHDLFAAQAAQTPQATAVRFANSELTYQELNARANQLARSLQARGVGPDSLVGIYLERSLEMAVAVLGVLKAGGTYLPLDPGYPEDRLAYMIEDSQTSLLLTEEQLAGWLNGRNLQHISLDSQWAEIAAADASDLPHRATPDSLAYVIYTSGSTGQPKGVLVPHRGLLNYSTAVAEKYSLMPADRVLQFASLSFDVAAEEMFPTWISGAALVLRSDEILLSFADFLKFIAQEQLTVLNLPAPYWQEWTAELVRSQTVLPPSLRLVVTGSDKVASDAWQQWQTAVGQGIRLINVYGPTEATIGSSLYEKTDQPLAGSSVPIGRPLANTQIYLLDAHRQPVPIGVPGELHIGGAGVARGYLNRPALTAEKFIPNPFTEAGAPGLSATLYKTGDLARYLADGNIEFLGRIDQQVKIRGFRIELGEIEEGLRQHTAVQESIVLAREDDGQEKRLVAYVVAQETVSASDLYAWLKERLPYYMLPSTFVFLDSLPQTPSGKLDRRALPQPDYSQRPELEKPYVAPRTPVEKLLATIWADILKLPQVGVYDDFFDLGGHSLLGTQVISRIRATMRVALPLRTLFESPTIASLGAAILQEGTDFLPSPQIPRRANTAEALPLSFAQQRLWFLETLRPDQSLFNSPSAIQLSGMLDVRALTQSCNEIVRRHDVLRATFTAVAGEPQQHIEPYSPFPLPLVDFQDMLPTAQAEAVQTYIREEVEQPFSLTQGPLFRFKLLRLRPNEHILLFTMHHIVFDGWSAGVFMHELAVLYEAYRHGDLPALPGLPIQYADYALWQREQLDETAVAQLLTYWRQQLQGDLPVLELPTDWPRTAVASHRGASQSVTLPPALTQKLKLLTQQEGATLFMTLLAAFNILLARYTGETDILIGTPIANRNKVEIEGLIGFFVNTLVIRTDLSGSPSFKTLLRRVRQTTLAAYDHQELPFEKVVEALQPERHLNHAPLFQVMFILQNTPDDVTDLADLKLTGLEIGSETAEFDLTLAITETGDTLVGSLAYNSDLFTAATIDRMLGHFHTLLAAIAEQPEKPISQLPLLTSGEQQQLQAWSKPDVVYPPADRLVHQLFAAQTGQNPQATAVLFEDTHLTYGELNRRANQLAHYLQQVGVGPETVVGLFIERSPEVVVAMLAIFKAGGVYLPLDRDYPMERLAYMLADSGAQFLLTQSELAAQLPTVEHIICLDEAWGGVIAHQPTWELETAVSPNNLAYIIYTSGSTGQPKGVMIEHAALAAHCQNSWRDYALTAEDVVLQFASFSFDTAMEQILTPLIAGSQLVLRGRDLWHSHDLQRKIDELGITVANLPTAYWHQLAQFWYDAEPDKRERYRSLRLMIVGGEAMSVESLRMWQATRPSSERLLNAYGPTETTVTSTLFEVPLPFVSPSDHASVPIGRPIGDRQLFVLDQQGQPVPVGVAGELYIGGAHLARGYINRPELTAEKFVPNPFSQQPGERLYRTGDLVRYQPDGNLAFLGRIDHQVKVRGFRIELGEVEVALRQHTAVQDALVLVQENGSGARLVAYVVGDGTKMGDLRPFLSQSLPSYMIPAAFVPLDSFPQTPNGKIDRKALPPPDGHLNGTAAAVYTVPQDALESQLAEIWQSVLKLPAISIDANYFELGGHSLQAVTLFAAIEKRLNLRLPVALLFEAPTIGQLAAVIRQRGEVPQWSSLVPIQPLGSKTPFFCVHGGAGHVIHYYDLARLLGMERPFYGVQPKMEAFTHQSTYKTVEEMAAHYLQEIKMVQPEGPYLLGGFCFGGIVAYEMAQQLVQTGDEVSLLAFIDPSTPENKPEITTAPLPKKLMGTLARQRSKLAQLGFMARIEYLYSVGKFVATAYWEQVYWGWLRQSRKGRSQLLQKYINWRQSVPSFFSDFYFMNMVAAPATEAYRPSRFPGKAVLFYSTLESGEEDNSLGWSDLPEEGLEMYAVESTHLGILKRPSIDHVAEILKQLLEPFA